jgi:hypothetical protein
MKTKQKFFNPTARSETPWDCYAGQHGYLMVEALVYISLVFVILGVGYAALYHCIDNSVVLRQNADDIANALHAGERWRADVRAASGGLRAEDSPDGPTLYLQGSRGEIAYRFSTNCVSRRLGEGSWVSVLSRVKSSTMQSDPRQNVTAWRWELELQPRVKGSIKPGRVRPLFTFIAVPQTASSK